MHNDGKFTYSSGPKITQAVPVAQRTPTVPTSQGIPTMGTDSAFEYIDGRFMDIPEHRPGIGIGIGRAKTYREENLPKE